MIGCFVSGGTDLLLEDFMEAGDENGPSPIPENAFQN
jgi:hypothetical protein